MILQRLDREQQIVVVKTKPAGTGQDGDIAHGLQFGQRGLQPGFGGHAIDGQIGFGQQPAARFGLLIDEQSFQAGFAGTACRHQAGQSGADNQNLRVMVQMIVVVGVGDGWRVAIAGRGANDLFVIRPETHRPLEGFAVKAGRHETGKQTGQAFDIKTQARPAACAGGRQAFVEFDLRGLQVGNGVGTGFQLDQHIGFVGAGADHATRAAVFEAAGQQADAIGQQRRGQCVARMALIGVPVKPEAKGAAGVDIARPLRNTTTFHWLSPRACAAARALASV